MYEPRILNEVLNNHYSCTEVVSSTLKHPPPCLDNITLTKIDVTYRLMCFNFSIIYLSFNYFYLKIFVLQLALVIALWNTYVTPQLVSCSRNKLRKSYCAVKLKCCILPLDLFIFKSRY